MSVALGSAVACCFGVSWSFCPFPCALSPCSSCFLCCLRTEVREKHGVKGGCCLGTSHFFNHRNDGFRLVRRIVLLSLCDKSDADASQTQWKKLSKDLFHYLISRNKIFIWKFLLSGTPVQRAHINYLFIFFSWIWLIHFTVVKYRCRFYCSCTASRVNRIEHFIKDFDQCR